MTSRRSAPERALFFLRILAFVFVPVGFVGYVTTDAAFFDPESVFTLVFGLGVVCAILSIYLGIALHDPTE